jgi:membrane fusion protein, multidrug efflux system
MCRDAECRETRQCRSRALGLLLPLVLALGGCKSEAKVEPEIARPVKVAVVGEAVRGRTLTYSGVVRPRIESAVGFRIPGKIVERLVNTGDRVEVGQVIARLDDTDLRLAENSAKAAVDSARSRRDVTRDNFERARVLLSKGFMTRADYDTRHNEFDAAVSALDAAEAQLRQAANAVDYTTLRADKAGIVTAVVAEPGQVMNSVTAGQPVIMLAHADETEIAVAIPEQDAGSLAVSQPATISLWAGGRTSIEGAIREIAGQADAASRTYAVRIAVNRPPPVMRLGMTATVTLHIDEEPAAIIVPITALVENAGNTAVFVVDQAAKTVRRTDIAVGGIAAGGMRVENGLHAGDVVVTAGAQFLRDGMRVRMPGERAQARTVQAQ